jgi:hypothetical protein
VKRLVVEIDYEKLDELVSQITGEIFVGHEGVYDLTEKKLRAVKRELKMLNVFNIFVRPLTREERS